MAILVTVLSVSSAMIMHGLVQATANGSRAYFLRAHIQWQILPAYLVGAAMATGLFVSLTLVPNAAMILISIGLFPWAARALPALKGLNITHKNTAMFCGVIVTGAQLFAGASGPLLDIFYLNTPLTRHQVIATKALTQTLGHILKLFYYTLIIQVSDSMPVWVLILAMGSAIFGTRVGTRLVDRFSDAQFRKVSSQAILVIGTLCLVKGIRDLLA